MKNFFTLSFVLLAVVFVAGCTEQANQNASINQNTNTTQTAAQAQEIVYTNSEYAFTLTLPSTWEGYGTQLGPKADGVPGTSDRIAFNLPAQTPLFVIYIEPKILWEDMQEEEGPKPTYLAKNSEYVFSYSMTQDAANETMVARIAEIKDIIKTFKLSTEVSIDPLSYTTIDVDVSMAKTAATFDLTASQLKDFADECGSEHSDGYFDELVLKFSGTEITHYNFTYIGDSQESDTYRLTLMPNIPGYTTLSEFKKDFDICAAGGGTYPIMLNNDWLVFENSCGSGLDDGSGKPIGCQEVKDVIKLTLKLNSDSKNVYKWETQGITFSYPDGYNVLERSDGSLYITTATELPDGDGSVFSTLLEIDSSVSLEERIAEYSTEETFSQETKVIGGHEFTKISLYANFGGFDYARYLLGFDGKLLDYKAGKNEEDLALEVLESIQF